MKKIVLALVVLMLAAPAWAAVNITVAQDAEDDCVAIISFDARTEANLVRAFGINIQLDNDANVIAVAGLNADYYIYPGTIQIDASGNVTSYGSPAAEYGDLPSDTLAGPPDGNGVTIEMASLYAPIGSVNEPDPCGLLVSVRVNKECTLTITANVSRAGPTGVVMENPDEVVTVNFPAPIALTGCGVVTDCYTGMPDYDQFEAVGGPECWCYPRQCLGDADGYPQGKQNYWVSTNDLAILKAAWSKPAAQLVGNEACADFDHLAQGKQLYRVSTNDLAILKANWSLANLPAPNCLPGNEAPD